MKVSHHHLLGAFEQKLSDDGGPQMTGFVFASSKVALPTHVSKSYDPECATFEKATFWKQFVRVSSTSSSCFVRSFVGRSQEIITSGSSMVLQLKPTATFVVAFDAGVIDEAVLHGDRPRATPLDGIVGTISSLEWNEDGAWGSSTQRWEPEGLEIFYERHQGPQLQFYGRMSPDCCRSMKFSGFSFIC